MNTLIKNAWIITCNENFDIIKNSYLLIEDGKFKSITENIPEGEFDIIDANGGIVMPGLVNAHTHSPMTFLRGYADGYPLEVWLNEHIFPKEALLTDEDVYYSSLLGIMEMISSGTTLFADMYDFCDSIADAVEESGMKALLSRGTTYFDSSVPFEKHKGTIESIELLKRKSDRISVAFSPHAVYTTTPEFIEYFANLAKDNSAILHIHLSETISENKNCINKYGKTPTQLIFDAGAFDTKVLAAHCVHLTDEDIDILTENGAAIAHNPTSNLKLGSGVADITSLKKATADICIGTDGTSSNNTLNMLKELNIAALLTCGVKMDPLAVNTEDVIRWATNSSALGFGDTGVIKEGKKADFVILSCDEPNMLPCHNPVSNVVYSANASNVKYVFVDGKMLYNNGSFLTLDKEKIYFNFNKTLKRIFK